jgi:diaminohydroxyphosphoribosylaminopyrimidine deaminase/5-amino-6-(5-phosphoribosylamino)uracil reductase
MNDEMYMQMALDLAIKGQGFTAPNPMVGCVIVKHGHMIGTGYHHQFGGLHAERQALQNCTEKTEGATLYVTLEPCCHYGKTPPCTDAIRAAKIKRVVIGTQDPHDLVAGKGIAILKQAGIEVTVGVLEQQCQKMNEIFFHFIRHHTPFVMMKYAMTLDGKIATITGASRWITGEKARAIVHTERGHYRAIMVGIGTVLQDNPLLSCHNVVQRNPIRIILDSSLRTPLDAYVVQTAQEQKTLIVTSQSLTKDTIPYLHAGCEILSIPETHGLLHLPYLMKELGKRNIDSILLEGGSQLNFSALQAGIVQKIETFVAPKIFGGEKAKTPVGGDGLASIPECITVTNQTISFIGDDIRIISEVKQACLQES